MFKKTRQSIFAHSRSPEATSEVFASLSYIKYAVGISAKKTALIPCLVFLFLFLIFPDFAQAAGAPKRIISLAPSMTEILFALGLEDRIVGVTSFCDFPEEAKKKQKIGGMSNPSLEAVVSLKPDIVIMTTDGNPKEFEERLRSLKIKTYVFRARQIPELAQGIREIGLALGIKEKADALAKDMETSIDKLKQRRPSIKKKKVLFIIWPDPLIVAGPGSITGNAITIAGGENIAAESKSSYPKYSIEEVIHQAPDIIFIGRGMGMEKVSQGLLKKLKSVPAIKNKRVFYVSDKLYRLGPRTVKGVEELAGYMEQQR